MERVDRAIACERAKQRRRGRQPNSPACVFFFVGACPIWDGPTSLLPRVLVVVFLRSRYRPCAAGRLFLLAHSGRCPRVYGTTPLAWGPQNGAAPSHSVHHALQRGVRMVALTHQPTSDRSGSHWLNLPAHTTLHPSNIPLGSLLEEYKQYIWSSPRPTVPAGSPFGGFCYRQSGPAGFFLRLPARARNVGYCPSGPQSRVAARSVGGGRRRALARLRNHRRYGRPAPK